MSKESDSYTEVYVWGSDSHGQLGIESQQQESVVRIPRSCTFNILIAQISCGASHSALITGLGHLYMMGDNTYGQLGVQLSAETRAGSPCLVESMKRHVVGRVSCGRDFTVVIAKKGEEEGNEVYGWGNN